MQTIERRTPANSMKGKSSEKPIIAIKRETARELRKTNAAFF